MVFGVDGLQCRTPLVIPPLLEPAGYRSMQALALGYQSGVSGELPLPSQPVLQLYLIMDASGYTRPWVVTQATLGT